MSYIKACVITCKRPLFWRYLMHRTVRLVLDEDDALKAVRLLTGIRSRKELTRCPSAAMEWQRLITDFNKWNTKQ